MEGHGSIGQSPQWAVVPIEEEEEYYNTIVLQLPTVFSTVSCCAGLLPRSNRLYTMSVCLSTLYYVRTTTKSPNDAFLRTYSRR